MLKKILIISFSILLLFSCGSDSKLDSSLIEYENNNFKMKIPNNWDDITDKEDILPKANIGKIELALISKTTISGFANSMLILSTDLNKITNSRDYSMLNNIGAEKDYLNYLKLSSKEINFIDGETSILYEFEAKYNYESPKLKFLQTAHICNQNKAYLITIALPITIKDISRYSDFISSFSCK